MLLESEYYDLFCDLVFRGKNSSNTWYIEANIKKDNIVTTKPAWSNKYDTRATLKNINVTVAQASFFEELSNTPQLLHGFALLAIMRLSKNLNSVGFEQFGQEAAFIIFIYHKPMLLTN